MSYVSVGLGPSAGSALATSSVLVPTLRPGITITGEQVAAPAPSTSTGSGWGGMVSDILGKGQEVIDKAKGLVGGGAGAGAPMAPIGPSEPWYAKTSNWLIIGALGVAGVLVARKLRRRQAK